MSDNGPPNFWDYQARRAEKEAKREAKIPRKTEEFEKTQDVWHGTEVHEHRLTETGLNRVLKLFGRGK